MRLRRFEEKKTVGNHPIILADSQMAIREVRTLFPKSVRVGSFKILKSGMHSRKIGRKVVKGRWSGMPIFTLTLEERKTCPRSCSHWNDCYGNHMHWAHRHAHGQYLEEQLDRELRTLQYDHPNGFVVRLHVLGDFYSNDYVMFWYQQMLKLPALHVFGFTAHPQNTFRGSIITALHYRFPDRWWVRHSDGDNATWLSTGEIGITCPMQQGKTDCCGTCGLC